MSQYANATRNSVEIKGRHFTREEVQEAIKIAQGALSVMDTVPLTVADFPPGTRVTSKGLSGEFIVLDTPTAEILKNHYKYGGRYVWAVRVTPSAYASKVGTVYTFDPTDLTIVA